MWIQRLIHQCILAFSFTLCWSTAWAENNKIDGFPARVLSGETASPATVIHFRSPFENKITIDGRSISLGETHLNDIKTVAGGTIHHKDEAEMHRAWLCYDLTGQVLPRRIWFIAQSETSQIKDYILTTVSAEVTKTPNDSCSPSTLDLSALALPVPGLRDTSSALKLRFGQDAKTEIVRYANEHSVGKTIVRQSLVYQLDGSQIIAVAFSQTSEH